MAFEYTEQLLTPENSRSETSSNNENASTEEKPTLRRRSTRVARASLQKAADLRSGLDTDTPETLSPAVENALPVTDEVLAVAGKKTHAGAVAAASVSSSHLRHSIAVMESSLWSETHLALDTAEPEDHPMAPDTPVSKSSQESPSEANPPLQQRTLRKRVERVFSKEGFNGREKSSGPTDTRKDAPLRRSSRVSLLQKASDFVGRAQSVLGKRSRGAVEKGKDDSRRASLRPRPAPVKEETQAPNNEPATKRRRVSESDLAAKIKENEEKRDESTTPAPVTRYRPKRWLAHGLYAGQEPVSARPLQNKNNKTSKRRSISGARRKLLPLPMFAGDRLLRQGRDFKLPFDIFSPLPPGQPKPNEWRKTNKNVFVGEAGSIWRANKDLELSKCMCTEETGCDENCQNRYMFYECDDGNCSLGPGCGNRNFNELKQRTKAGGKYNIGVEVIKTADRGYGVRSNRTFDPNQIIVEYTGEIITQSECEKRMRTIYKNNECYYLMYFDQNMIIDATRGSIARFVNHSCEPNCRMEKWTVAGKPRMALFAGDRGVMTGEELTYDYNFDPYSQKNVQQCRCGSANCRGVLGPRPKEKERAKELRAEAKKAASAKKTSRKSSSTRRRIGAVLDGPTSRITKTRKRVTSRSIKSGVKKAISRVRGAAKATTSRRTTAQKAKDDAKASKKTGTTTRAPRRRANKKESNEKVKLPRVRATKARATVRVRKPAQKNEKTEAKATPGQLTRPSEKTKARILATVKGANARKRTTTNKSPAKQSPRANASTQRARTTSRSPRKPKA
ncbi:conserved hypothetical protein [Aspergillus terreus NIH2624]|uniref:Histone-lysine N-methyltransferase n=1 Tax=Aspergillus terreus (strain NIH 2624 / FGSC A1156) TaxID=341663 RepID=Q0CC08_ASPTN|nr:uncharacterized protein ATEG_08776 [Aspergillus terreus NIH2624]EAU30908.1 conserved hypothetical protein [Aspergillus terreus NIH2624]